MNLPRKPRIDESQYGYATGRIRAMEVHLMDSARLSRVFEARSLDEIARVMQESGYPPAEPETSLALEASEVYQLAETLIPDRLFVEALLIFNDFHNLKVIEKYLATWWLQAGSKTELDYETDPLEKTESRADFDTPQLPESASAANFSSIASLMQRPSLVEPEKLFRSIRDRQTDLIPKWLYQAAVDAAMAVRARYDVAEIDQVLDRLVFSEAFDRAHQLGNTFFLDYLKIRADLTHLNVLLRVRRLRAGQRLLERTLIPEGFLSHKQILSWFDLEPSDLEHEISATRYASFAFYFGENGTLTPADQFGKDADHLILDHLQKARFILRGPEIPLAYVIARLQEIKNIRIAQTLLRNKIPAAKGRDMMRDSYFGRR